MGGGNIASRIKNLLSWKQSKLRILFAVLATCAIVIAVAAIKPASSNSEPFIPKDHYSEDEFDELDLGIEFTFWREHYDEPCALWGSIVDFLDENPRIIMVPNVGGYKDIEIRSWDGFTIKSSIAHESSPPNEEPRVVYSLESTREDIVTYRGIHVGNSLEDVFSVYSDLTQGVDLQTWKDDPYTDNEVRCTPKEYWGSYAPLLIFHIEDDTVVEIEMRYTSSK